MMGARRYNSSAKLRRAARLAELGARGEFHLKRRSFARRRLHPDTAAVHLHDLLGDGEAQASATLGLGQRAVDLMELFEDTRLLRGRNAGTRVGHSNVEVPVYSFGCHTHLASIRELDGVPNKVE